MYKKQQELTNRHLPRKVDLINLKSDVDKLDR